MPNNFESESKALRTLVLSVNKQSAWGAAAVLADTALTRVQRFDGSAVIDMTPTRRSDKEMSGKGTYFATNGQVTAFDLKISGIKSECSDWLAAWVLSFLMGKDVVTGVASPFTHTHTFDQTTRQAVPTTAYFADTDGLQYKAVDLHVSSATFTIPDTGAISVEYDLMGTGVLIPGAMVALPAIPQETYILGSDCDFLWGNVGAPASILGRHMTSTIKFESGAKVHRAPGGGLTGIFIRKESPKFSISSTIAAKATDDVFNRLTGDVKTAIGLNANSGAAAQLAFSIPSANLKTAKMGFDGDMIVWNVEADETTCYQVGGVQPITATVINSVAAYLTAAA